MLFASGTLDPLAHPSMTADNGLDGTLSPCRDQSPLAQE